MASTALMTLAVTSTMVFGATDAFDKVRGAALNIKSVYAVAAKVNYNDPASEKALLNVADGLNSIASIAADPNQIAMN